MSDKFENKIKLAHAKLTDFAEQQKEREAIEADKAGLALVVRKNPVQ